MGGTIQKNVIATKPGVNAPNRFVILDGHYDSIVFDGTDPMVFAPGVDDNGTGIAGVLEMARILNNLETNVTFVFIAFDAEEWGLYGSEHYAANARLRGDQHVEHAVQHEQARHVHRAVHPEVAAVE